MEQRPPKSPITMSHNCTHYSFPYFQMMPQPPLPLTAAASTWVDDFLDFSATRRSHHRRTVSDPIAFVETPTLFQENNNNNNYDTSHGFERLDDEQLRNMFSDDVGPVGLYPGSNTSSANPSTPPSSDDHNGSESMSDEKIKFISSSQPNVKNEPGEEDSSNNQQNYNTTPLELKDSSDQAIFDPKRIKRILANRQSAQRSRVRKLHYISELERSVTTLQTEVSALSPRVAFLDHQRLLLNVDNSALKQRIAALAQDKIFKDAHQEALRKEIERLKRIYHEQTMKKMNNDAKDDEPPPFAVITGKKRVSSEE